MLDLRIRGRKAIVCAASKGLGRACATALARAGVELVITARTNETLEATADEIRKETGAKVTAGRRRHLHRGRPRRRARRLPEPRHPGQQLRRPAAWRFSRMVGRGLAEGGQRQHADPDHADQGGGGRHVRAQLRPHRQHHFGVGEIADPQSRHEQRRARRADRVLRRPRASGREVQCDDQWRAARPVSDRPAALRDRVRGAAPEHLFRGTAGKRGSSNPAGRVGDPAEFGDACAFLCGASSGFIVGQNLLLDGGAFNSTMG